ncbi:Ig-like domain-containing protein [Fulvivirgaceae bacterium BMA10]|uniref:Ig-like domain-containing protein n=1 Tax=Splendidivirga corallicola TaxID=3051826 RepID=A0ABT8KHK0_9BACT|nr:Ig-like domain-containing protein [Fulvivirgaceae bacterium BMA10]
MAEGTREYRPTSSDFGNIRIGDALQPDLQVRFATFIADETEKMKVRIKDPSREIIYFGFNISLGADIYFRLRDPNDNIVIASALVPASGTGHIASYGQAVIGPAQVAAGGYDAMSYTPLLAGDYVVEFNAGDPSVHTGNEFVIDLFDVTVYDHVDDEVRTGRLWSQKWAGNTGNFENPFIGEYYIYSTIDSTLSLFEPNGMRPFTFEIFANSTGPFNTGNILQDRRSAFGREGVPEYLLFLNAPDSSLFPYARVQAQFVTTPEIRICDDDFCIDINVNKRGTIEIFIDLDGVAGFQEGGEDVSFQERVDPGLNTIVWDGMNGLGEDVRLTEDIVVTIGYGSTPTHIPIFDVESNPNGFKATTLKPAFQVETLHFDDVNLPGGMENLEGCASPCHEWLPTSGCCSSIGNARTVNTWWFSNKSIEMVLINPSNLPPFLGDDLADTVAQGEQVTVTYINNDSDPNDNLDLSTFTIVNGPGHGTIEIDTLNGSMIYTADSDYIGPDTLEYSICDTGVPVYCETALIFFNVKVGNQPPEAMDDHFSMNNQELLEITYLPNDDDPDNNLDPDSFRVLSGPHYGNIVSDPNGRFLYVPNAGFTGADSIRYEICDLGTPPLCDTATIYIQVDQSPECIVDVHTGFSPNGDGINDQFKVNGIHCYPENTVKIFNRWGNLVYKGLGYNNDTVAWDGTANSGLLVGNETKLPNGTYFYIIEINRETDPIQGYVVLKR